MKKHTPKVSIIVPIYNVEKYLRQCLDSIVSQTLKDIEIILVDDGSTDNSPAIVDEYAAKDKRIVAIHKPNGGLGHAYNTGVANATGEYIGFVESDDWVEPDMFELLYNAVKKYDADISKAPFYVYDSTAKTTDTLWKLKRGKEVILDLTTNAPTGVFTIQQLPELAFMHSSLWSYLYRADFVRQIPFMEDKGASYQDFPFVFEVLCRAKSIVVVPKPLLHWRLEMNQNNSTQQVGQQVLKMAARNLEGKEILKKHGKYDELKEAFYFHCFTSNFGFYQKIKHQYRYEYMLALHEVFKDIAKDKDFCFKYFDKKQKNWVQNIIRKNYIRSLFNSPNDWKRFLFSIRINRKKGFLVQLLGFQISSGKYAKKEQRALLAWRIGA
jgi:glycosyltransferase involved in cell wall biosynthesis